MTYNVPTGAKMAHAPEPWRQRDRAKLKNRHNRTNKAVNIANAHHDANAERIQADMDKRTRAVIQRNTRRAKRGGK